MSDVTQLLSKIESGDPSAEALRRILIKRARQRSSLKRGSGYRSFEPCLSADVDALHRLGPHLRHSNELRVSVRSGPASRLAQLDLNDAPEVVRSA